MRRIFFSLGILLLMLLLPQLVVGESVKPNISKNKSAVEADSKTTSSFPLRRNIVTTYFWIGQGGTPISATTNIKSAWDSFWKKNFGGIDCPDQRKDAKK